MVSQEHSAPTLPYTSKPAVVNRSGTQPCRTVSDTASIGKECPTSDSAAVQSVRTDTDVTTMNSHVASTKRVGRSSVPPEDSTHRLTSESPSLVASHTPTKTGSSPHRHSATHVATAHVHPTATHVHATHVCTAATHVSTAAMATPSVTAAAAMTTATVRKPDARKR